MFAIYTPNGRSFFGPLEHLRDVEKPTATKATREQQEIDETLSFGRSNYNVSDKAIEAYRETINKPNTKELITHAYQVMTTPVQAINGDSPITTAIEKFRQEPFEEFPIVDSNHLLVGTLSRQQLYEYMLRNGGVSGAKNSKNTVTEQFLSDNTQVYAAEPVTSIRRIAQLLLEKDLHTMPIMEGEGKIVGIISRTDIIKATVNDLPLSLWA